MTPDEMRAKAAETGHTDPVWAVGAEICERLESVLEALMEEVAFNEVAMPEMQERYCEVINSGTQDIATGDILRSTGLEDRPLMVVKYEDGDTGKLAGVARCALAPGEVGNMQIKGVVDYD